MPSDLGFFWALPIATNSLTETRYEYGLIQKNSRAVVYDTGISTGGFENLDIGDRITFNRESETAYKREYFSFPEPNNFLEPYPKSAEDLNVVIDPQTLKYWNLEPSMSQLVNERRFEVVLTRTDVS